MALTTRAYEESDATASFEVFVRAIRETASRDYTAEQVEAWANVERDPADWERARVAANTRIAEIDGRVIGFTDVNDEGYIDMLYVDPTHACEGVGSALLVWAEATARAAGATRLSTHASITARPLLEARGFVVEEQRTPVVRGVAMTNFAMSRRLSVRDQDR